jgi:diguanylate cyclase (GGDEF)-like protein
MVGDRRGRSRRGAARHRARPVERLSKAADTNHVQLRQPELTTYASFVPFPLFALSMDGGVAWANEAWFRLVGRDADAPEPLPWIETVHPLDRAAASVASGRLVTGGEASVEHRVLLPGGGVRWARTTARLVNGAVLGWSEDLTAERTRGTEIDVLRAVFERESRTDPLTRVSTRVALKERLAAELARADRDGATPGLVLLELQGLRAVNERLGQAAGDEVLLTVARRLADVVRRYDTVGRWDGARFAVVAPSLTSQAALNAVAGKLQAAVERRPVDVDGIAVPVFATVGCARAVGRGHTVESVVAASEAALADARMVGPGGVSLAPDNPSVVDAAGGEAVRLARALAVSAAEREGVPQAHAGEVADLSARLARSLGMPARAVLTCRLAGWLHDVGMACLPDAILRETGPLTPDARALMQQHAVAGEEVVRRVGGLELASTTVRHHHERWDGTGYPDRLAGEDIPLEARIVAAADAYASMTGERAHRPARTEGEAFVELLDCAGTQLDPRVVDALLELVGRAYSAAA